MGYTVIKEKNTNRYRLRLTAERQNAGYIGNSKAPQVLQNGQWRGQRCFIVGGGESIKRLDFRRLDNERTIVINRAFEICPNADILFMMDVRFMQWLQDGVLDKYAGNGILKKFNEFRGLKIFLNPMTMFKFPSDVYVVRRKVDDDMNLDLVTGLKAGTNSGFTSIMLAMVLGADPIYLLGYDMKGGHWHSGYPNQEQEEFDARLLGYKEEMKNFAPVMSSLGFRIMNLNPDSGLKCFASSTLEELGL